MLQIGRILFVVIALCALIFFGNEIRAQYYSLPEQGTPGQPNVESGQSVPSQQDLLNQIDDLDKQIQSLEKKRDSMKQSNDYFTNQTSGYQADNGLSYRQNADREKYYQAQISQLELQIASLKAKRDHLKMLVH